MSSLISHLYPRLIRFSLNNLKGEFCKRVQNQNTEKKVYAAYLAVDTINLRVLVLQFWSHIKSHVAKVTNHCIDLAHVLFHLIFPCIICNSDKEKEKEIYNKIQHWEIWLLLSCSTELTFQCSLLVDPVHCGHPWHAEVDCWRLCHHHFPSRFLRLPWMRLICNIIVSFQELFCWMNIIVLLFFSVKDQIKTHLLQGRTQIPQHFSMPVKFFSASFMSALIWSIPSSMRSSCSVEHKHRLASHLKKKITLYWVLELFEKFYSVVKEKLLHIYKLKTNMLVKQFHANLVPVSFPCICINLFILNFLINACIRFIIRWTI